MLSMLDEIMMMILITWMMLFSKVMEEFGCYDDLCIYKCYLACLRLCISLEYAWVALVG